MKIGMACDHGAYTYKEEIKQMLIDEGHEVVDCGCHDTNSVDYPDMAKACADLVANKEVDKGIVMCGTGIGNSIAANKVKGAYAALVNNVYQAQRAQLSNNANIITMGAQVTGIELAKCLVKEYLSVSYDPNSRSAPKVARITEYENEK